MRKTVKIAITYCVILLICSITGCIEHYLTDYNLGKFPKDIQENDSVVVLLKKENNYNIEWSRNVVMSYDGNIHLFSQRLWVKYDVLKSYLVNNDFEVGEKYIFFQGKLLRENVHK